MASPPQIFLSYAREDREAVQEVYRRLYDEGLIPWMDTRDILPGEDWDSAIKKVMRKSDFILLFLSNNSINKRGVIQKEFKFALEMRKEMLANDIFLIPVRLEECKIPDEIGSEHCIDLFKEDEWSKLLKAIEIGIQRRWGGDALSDLLKKGQPGELREPLEKEQGDSKPHHVDFKPVPRDTGAKGSKWKLWVSIGVGLFAIIVIGWVMLYMKTGPNSNEAAKINVAPTRTPTPRNLSGNWDMHGVIESNPPVDRKFTINVPHVITKISNYHGNWDGITPPSTDLKLLNSAGTEVGTWEVKTNFNSTNPVDRLTWTCSPNFLLSAGTYTVIDPDPATWSYKSNSFVPGGMSLIEGYPASGNTK